jgi:ferric iron reductase protein FhuF
MRICKNVKFTKEKKIELAKMMKEIHFKTAIRTVRDGITVTERKVPEDCILLLSCFSLFYVGLLLIKSAFL